MADVALERDSQRLDKDPPRPPRQGKSLMAMAAGSPDSNPGIDMSNPAVRVMSKMGEARKVLLELASMLPTLAAGLQQIVTGLEQVVPQQVADMVAGNPPGSGGSGMGAPQANAAPTAPPVQTGMA